MFNVVCELSQPMGKTEFSSTAKTRTNFVSKVRKINLHGHNTMKNSSMV